MKLNVLTRLMLLNNLPEQGSLEKMINRRNIKDKIIFSSEEFDKLELKTSDVGVTWKPIDDIEVEFTNTEILFIKDILDKMSDDGLISEGIIDFALAINDMATDND